MSFIDDLFGGGKTKETRTVTPTTATTYMPGYTFGGFAGSQPFAFGPTGATVGVNPQVRSSFAKFGGLTDTALQRTGGLIRDLKGNANPFINARIRPLQESINERRMDLSRGLSQRGVQGSLANNEMLKFDTAAQRELSDQRAKLTQDTLSALYQAEGLDQSVRGEVLSLADSYLKTSLSELGVSLEGMRMALSGMERQATGPGSVTFGSSDPPMDILGSIGKIISIGKAV